MTRDPDAAAPAGGVSSSARDLVKWLSLEVNNGKFGGKQLIAEAALGATHEPVIMRGKNVITGQPGFYGLGWNVDFGRHGVSFDHAGAFSRGARTLASMLPGEKLGIVVLSNAFPTGVPEGIADSFYDIVLDGEPSRDWIATWNGIYDSYVRTGGDRGDGRRIRDAAGRPGAGAAALGLCRHLCQRLSSAMPWSRKRAASSYFRSVPTERSGTR